MGHLLTDASKPLTTCIQFLQRHYVLDASRSAQSGRRTAYTNELQHQRHTNIKIKHADHMHIANRREPFQAVENRGLTDAQFKRVPTSSRYQVSKPTASVPPSTIIAIIERTSKHQDASNLTASSAHRPTHQPRLLHARSILYSPLSHVPV